MFCAEHSLRAQKERRQLPSVFNSAAWEDQCSSRGSTPQPLPTPGFRLLGKGATLTPGGCGEWRRRKRITSRSMLPGPTQNRVFCLGPAISNKNRVQLGERILGGEKSHPQESTQSPDSPGERRGGDDKLLDFFCNLACCLEKVWLRRTFLGWRDCQSIQH